MAGEVTTDKFLPRLTEEERDVRWGNQVTMQGLWLLVIRFHSTKISICVFMTGLYSIKR